MTKRKRMLLMLFNNMTFNWIQWCRSRSSFIWHTTTRPILIRADRGPIEPYPTLWQLVGPDLMRIEHDWIPFHTDSIGSYSTPIRFDWITSDTIRFDWNMFDIFIDKSFGRYFKRLQKYSCYNPEALRETQIYCFRVWPNAVLFYCGCLFQWYTGRSVLRNYRRI